MRIKELVLLERPPAEDAGICRTCTSRLVVVVEGRELVAEMVHADPVCRGINEDYLAAHTTQELRKQIMREIERSLFQGIL